MTELVLAVIACAVVLVLLFARILLPPDRSWREVPGFAVVGLEVLGRKGLVLLSVFLHELLLRVVEIAVCWPRGHRYKCDAIGIARCRRCKREAIEGFGELRRGWR